MKPAIVCDLLATGEIDKVNRILVQSQCEAALASGGYFTIETHWRLNDWRTVYTIYWPQGDERK